MDLAYSPIFLAVAIPAVILTGLAKGGFAGLGMMSTPLIALAVSPVKAAALMLPILLIQDAFSLWNYRREYDSWNLKVMMPSALIGVASGYFLAAYVSDALVAVTLGAISVIFGLRGLLHRPGLAGLETRPNVAFGWFCGVLSGFTSMIAHTGGPPFQIYVMPQKLPRDVYIGTSVLFFAVLNVVKIAPYFALGQFSGQMLITALVLAPVAILSTMAGIKLVRRVDHSRFYVLTYGLLVLVGFKLIWDGIGGILV